MLSFKFMPIHRVSPAARYFFLFLNFFFFFFQFFKDVRRGRSTDLTHTIVRYTYIHNRCKKYTFAFQGLVDARNMRIFDLLFFRWVFLAYRNSMKGNDRILLLIHWRGKKKTNKRTNLCCCLSPSIVCCFIRIVMNSESNAGHWSSIDPFGW